MYLRFKNLQAAGILTNRHDLARKIESQGFPRPLELGPNKVAWRKSEIDEWLSGLPRREPKTGASKGPSAIVECRVKRWGFQIWRGPPLNKQENGLLNCHPRRLTFKQIFRTKPSQDGKSRI